MAQLVGHLPSKNKGLSSPPIPQILMLYGSNGKVPALQARSPELKL
jgi:hypothetical protein